MNFNFMHKILKKPGNQECLALSENQKNTIEKNQFSKGFKYSLTRKNKKTGKQTNNFKTCQGFGVNGV